MKSMKKLALSLSALLPVSALAQLTQTETLITRVRALVSSLIILVAGVALLAFFWGLAKFIFRVGGDEKAVESGKNLMKWGLIALFVMMSVWGIIRFFQSELNLNNNTAPNTITITQPA